MKAIALKIHMNTAPRRPARRLVAAGVAAAAIAAVGMASTAGSAMHAEALSVACMPLAELSEAIEPYGERVVFMDEHNADTTRFVVTQSPDGGSTTAALVLEDGTACVVYLDLPEGEGA